MCRFMFRFIVEGAAKWLRAHCGICASRAPAKHAHHSSSQTIHRILQRVSDAQLPLISRSNQSLILLIARPAGWQLRPRSRQGPNSPTIILTPSCLLPNQKADPGPRARHALPMVQPPASCCEQYYSGTQDHPNGSQHKTSQRPNDIGSVPHGSLRRKPCHVPLGAMVHSWCTHQAPDGSRGETYSALPPCCQRGELWFLLPRGGLG
jgi:hypothetical protein